MSIKTLIIAHTNLSKPKTLTDIKATTLDELRKEVTDVDLSDKFNIVERSTKTTLERGDAKLPNADTVVLFVSQKNIKAGTSAEDMSRAELMAVAKEARETEEGVKHFGNYSNTSSVELREKVAKWQLATKNSNNSDTRAAILAKLDELKEFVTQADMGGVEEQTFEQMFLSKIETEFKEMKKG